MKIRRILTHRHALFGGIFLLLSGISANAWSDDFVEGAATYRERMALTPSAVFEATLEDITLADAPATVLGRTRIPSPGNPPIQFSIPYDPGAIEADHRYSVRASIRDGQQLLFVTDQTQPVLTDGNGQAVSLMLRRSGSGGSETPAKTAENLAPATYLGVLPCADCPGIHYEVDLFSDGVYYQRMTYAERDIQVDSIGRWLISGQPRQLVLRDGGIQPERFAIINASTLRMLDGEGHEIPNGLNYDLSRSTSFNPIEPFGEFTGLYRQQGEESRFVECVTGLSLPVLVAGSQVDLSQAHERARKQLGEPLPIRVEGMISQRISDKQSVARPTLVINRIVKVSPGSACPEPRQPDFP
jgi:copper homeostasis protein (lipoprotein)